MKLLNMLNPSAMVVTLFLTGCTSARYAPPPVAGYPQAPPPRAHTDPAPPRVVVHPPAAPPRSYPRPEPWVDVSITVPERQVIQGYVAGYVIEERHPKRGKKPKRLPPGLQKKLDRGGSLPPGWEAKFRKGEILPVDIYEQAHSLPREVLAKLPPQPPGTVIITVGGKVARILAATREILDVFEVQY
jgi:hypothetical protein